MRIIVTIVMLLLAPFAAHAGHVNVIELDNQIISPVTQQYIADAIADSETGGAESLIIILDTPGGLLESTRGIVKRMMNAKVPIVVYVAPSGARAGSAGVFITLAAHIAAMAPSTNIGAAHPMMTGEGGGPVRKLIRRIKRAEEHEDADPQDDAKKSRKNTRKPAEQEIVEEEQQDPMADKILNDTVAWITTIARTRHRNEEWAAKAVTESFSVTEDEAVQQRIVDLEAASLEQLLERIDGWPVELHGETRTLAIKDTEVRRIDMTPRQQFLAVITNPSIAYLLMLLGTLGLVFEFTHPGVGFPGIAGAICLILALYAFQTLPVSYAGLALLGVGLALLVAEAFVTSFGLLALGGVISLTLGSLLLFEAPGGFGLSLRLIVPVVGGLSAVVVFLVNLAVRAQRRPAVTGTQVLIGQQATAETDLAPSGQVFARGELWSATSETPIRRGERVVIVGVDGLTLRVTPQK